MLAEMDLDKLRELGEWAALGFYEALKAPWPQAYGRAYRRLYENMEIVIPEGSYLIPHEPLPRSMTWPEDKVWTATALIMDHNHNTGLRWNPQIAERKKKAFPHLAAFIDSLTEDIDHQLFTSYQGGYFGGYTHTNPDMRRVVGEGFLSMEAELDGEIRKLRETKGTEKTEGTKGTEEKEALNLLLALKEYSLGVRAFHERTAAALDAAAAAARGERQLKLRLIAKEFKAGFMHPAQTFLQGLLAVNFTWMLDGCDSIGRFDQVLGTLFEHDAADGLLDLAFARQLLDELWRNFELRNGWNMQIGGYTPKGKDGCNALTRECLAACGRNRQRRPNVAFRITVDTPDDLVDDALKVLAAGSGRPALYNDDLYVKTLQSMDLGLTPEDAREIGFGGCTETMISGLSNCGSLEGDLNLAKALELALYDGYDPVAKTVTGPHTGSFEKMRSFNAFVKAVKQQIQAMTDGFCFWDKDQLTRRFHRGDPKMARTLFTRDCVKRHKSFEAGGARYNWAVVSYQGIANLIDSLAAIRKCVFEDKAISKKELITALQADFKDAEPLRRKLLHAPKFGNDNPVVDDLGREMIRFAWEALYRHETPRGGRYLASCILFATYGAAGKTVGATPDGRRAHEVLTDSVGAAQGRDTHGPTALLNSVAKLPLHLGIGTPVLNIRFQKDLMNQAAVRRKVISMIRTFFRNGGMQIQISTLDRDRMLAAQQDPEKHRDLIVRIGGYSEYFVALDKGLQDSVIARTEHGL